MDVHADASILSIHEIANAPMNLCEHPSAGAVRQESCSLGLVRRVAAMLDLDPVEFREGDALPRGWHFFLMGADTPRSQLRGDGFPGLGVPMPELGLPRLMLGGRSARFEKDIPIGASLTRTSRVESLQEKTSATGARMAVVTLLHELQLAGELQPALVETQTYLLLPQQPSSPETSGPGSDPSLPAAPPVIPEAGHQSRVVPDDTLLFQYSALGFNSHRIHLDRRHARDVEGFPDLVVNGGLVTLLFTELARREKHVLPRSMKAKHVAPLFANRPITLVADGDSGAGGRWHLRAFDDQHRLAVNLEVET